MKTKTSTTTSTTTTTKRTTTTTTTTLPPVLQEIADERMEFRIKLGRAMDTLRKDMSDILTKTPGMFFLVKTLNFFLRVYVCIYIYLIYIYNQVL